MADPYAQGGGGGGPPGAEGDDPLNLNSVIREVALMADKLKGDDDADYNQAYVSPYAYLEKAAVLQEARCFNDSVVVRENPRKCCTVIAQLLHLQNTGQFLSGTEATEGELLLVLCFVVLVLHLCVALCCLCRRCYLWGRRFLCYLAAPPGGSPLPQLAALSSLCRSL